MSKHILITGGSGLVGKHLTSLLLDKGYAVSHLSRKENNIRNVKTYLWDVRQGTIDQNCIDGVDVIIHLAGAGVADKLWTDERKQEISSSRTQSIRLIYQLLKEHSHQVKKVISASATGYYGNREDELMTEESAPAGDFLGKCCIDWEQAVDEGEALGLEILKLRTGVVLTDEGGALKQLALPIKFGFGAALGSGKQWIPWIHLQDTIDMYLFGIENPIVGVYNMVAPKPVTNQKLTLITAKQLRKPYWLPNVPAFILKLAFGEMSTVVLASTKVSAEKIEQAGFNFKFPTVKEAIREIYG